MSLEESIELLVRALGSKNPHIRLMAAEAILKYTGE
jgi:hypothetical protein